MMDIIRLDDVTFRRKDALILRGVSWRVREGVHSALLGANGSGKTTLLKVVTGYEWATSGSVSVLGRRFGSCNLPELRKTIGWVSSSLEHRVPPRDTALEVAMSGLEASLGLYRTFSSSDRHHASKVLGMLRAGHLADRAYELLSQGEKQRVLIARALVAQPRLLILDEPCAGLDPAARKDFLDDLAGFSASDHAPTMVLVTHHIEEIGPWIGHVTALRDGRIAAEGPPGAVLTDACMSGVFGRPCRVRLVEGVRYLDVG